MLSLYKLYAGHLEWLGARKSLTGQEQRFLHRWLCRIHPELVPHEPTAQVVWRQQCREIQRGSNPPLRGGLSMAALKPYAEELTRKYLAPTNAPRPPFADFLEKVLRECPTEDALQRFLGLPPLGSPKSPA